MPLQVELVSPEDILFSGECTQVLTRTAEGDIAFLSGHAPFIGALDAGEVQLWTGEGTTSVAVGGGFVEVSDNTVTILSDAALLPDQIDAEAARADLEAAEAALAADADDADAAALKRWAELRLRLSEG